MGQRLGLTAVIGAISAAIVAGSLAGAASAGAVPATGVPATGAPSASAQPRLSAVQDVGPIAVVDSGPGPVFPAGPAEVAVMPDGAVSSGDRPYLAVPRAMTASSDVSVRVVDASLPGAARPGESEGSAAWSGRLVEGWARIETALPAGGAYRVDVSAEGKAWTTAGWFVVRGAWSSGGTDVSAGGISISQVSGRASWAWSSPSLPGPVGSDGLSLGWTAGWAPPASLRQGLPAGLPTGWRLAAGTGSPWASLLVSQQDGIARAVGWDGSVLAFQRNGSGIWVQVTGGAPGFANELRRVGEDTWEFVAADGTITRFVGSGSVFRAARVYSHGVQVSQVTWDDRQRVTSVVNEVGRELRVTYADGAGACASQGWAKAGWAPVPSGMLCQVTYPDGSVTSIGYVAGAGGTAQIGMVQDPGNVAATLGWDARGRLVSERGVFANRVALVDKTARGVVTKVSYDGLGRASAVSLPAGSAERLTFPAVTEQVLKAWVQDRAAAEESSPVSARVSLQATGFDMGRTSYLDPTSWATLRAQDASGAQMRIDLDKVGRVSRQVDAQGRVTTYSYNDLGLVTGTTGPSAPDTRAATTGQEFDTRTDRGKQVDLVGLRALVGAGAKRVPEFWPATEARGGLSYSWSLREPDWAGQATGIWEPTAAERAAAEASGGWEFHVSSSGGQVAFRVAGRACEVDQAGRCELGQLHGSLQQVTVQVADGRPSGYFQVQAGPRHGDVRSIPFDEVRPGYGLATESSTNDVFPGRVKAPVTVSQYADPSSGQPSSVTAPGGLTSKYEYDSDRWHRLRTVTTPGGAQQSTVYWPDDAEEALPGECGGGKVRVSGQVRAITRQDGTVTTSWPDLSGRVVATQVTGGQGAKETRCISYFDDGSVAAVRSFDSAGVLAESTVNDPAVGGDYRLARSTVTKGPGAGDVALREVWSQVEHDIYGRVVQETGSSGVVSTTTYNSLGLPVTSRTTAQDGTVLTIVSAYRGRDAQVESVTVNGVLASKVSYDGVGRVSSIDYPQGLAQSYAYDQQGRMSRTRVRLGSQGWTDSLNRSSFGRILSEALVRDGSGDETRAYAYDPGTGRLAKATMTSGAASTTWNYGFGAEDPSCTADSYQPGKDGLRTTGSRDGFAYVACHDAAGRVESTTDPLVTGGAGIARIEHDGLGRLTSISGDAPVDVTWGIGEAMTRLVQGGDDTALVEMTDFGGSTVLRSVTTASGTQAVRYAGPFTLASDAEGSAGSVVATQYELPGGVQVTVTGSSAFATVADLSGSAMATVSLPELAGSTAEAGPLRPAPRFGPYGEPLSTPEAGDAVRDYAWRSGMGLETLPGLASITIMGARSYHPGLGEFLTPDPVVDGGDALYAYTSGDPVNYRDPSGGSEQAQWDTWLAAIGGGIAALVAGAAAWRAAASASLNGARAATWIAGIAGAAAVGGGSYLAVKAGADSETGLMIAGIAIAAVGATAGITGVVKGVRNVSRLRFRSDYLKNPFAVKIDSDWKFEIINNMWIDEGAMVGGRSSTRSSVGLSPRSSLLRPSSPIEQIPALKVDQAPAPQPLPGSGAPLLRHVSQTEKERLLRGFINDTDFMTSGRLPGFIDFA